MVNDASQRSSQTFGLNEVVQNLERQRQAVEASSSNNLQASKNNDMLDALDQYKDGHRQTSPQDVMQSSSNAAAAMMLRGDSSVHATLNHRRASSDVEVDVAEEEEESYAEESEDAQDQDAVHKDKSKSVLGGQLPLPVNKHYTFTEKEDKEVKEEEINLNDAEKRFIETQKLIASQSIPTPTQPHVMKTPTLPDSKRKKILVTGGAGFVGSHLVDKLMMEGHEVIVMDNFFTGQRKNVDHWMHHPRFSLIVHDVTEPIMLEVDEIYHLACPASPPHYQYNPVKTIKTSTMGTINMLGLAKRVKAKMLLTSTSEIYGDPEV